VLIINNRQAIGFVEKGRMWQGIGMFSNKNPKIIDERELLARNERRFLLPVM